MIIFLSSRTSHREMARSKKEVNTEQSLTLAKLLLSAAKSQTVNFDM